MRIRSTIKEIEKTTKQFSVHLLAFSVFFNIILFSSPLYMLQIYNRILPNRSEETLIWLTLLIVILFISMSAIDMARHLLFIRLSNVFENRVTKQAMARSLKVDRSIASTPGMGILRDVDQIRSVLIKGHLASLLDMLWFPVFVVAVGFVHPALAVLALAGGAWLALLAFLNHVLVTPAMEASRSQAVDALSMADQLFAKAEAVQALGMQTNLVGRWIRRRSRAVSGHATASDRHAAISSISRTSRMLAQSVTLGVGAYLAIQGSISAGAIIAASILVGRALAPIETSIGAWQDLQKAWSAFGRVNLFLRGDAESSSPPLTPNCQGRLSVEDLSYSIGNHAILRNVTFRADPGELIAIVGRSGCGKTTLARHLVGVWQATQGSVRLGDLDVAKLTHDMRLQHVGYLPQDVQLLDGTIIDSIGRFGTPDPERIVATAKLAGIHEMITRLPDHYGTRIGVDGIMLSAGQRQRLALARALYGEPNFVVLDEPCTHLDEANEQRLIQTLICLIERGVTVCLVTHKANQIRLASKVLILNAQGQARFGTPNDVFRPTLRPISTDDREVA